MNKKALGLLLIVILLASTGLAALDEGLEAYWKFNSGSGDTAKDSSGNSNSGSINGASWTGGRFEDALSFDGNDDYINVPMSSSLDFSGKSAVTVSAWIKPDTWSSENSGIVDQEKEDSWILREENGIVEFLIQDSNGDWHQDCGFSRPSTNNWNLVTGKYNKTGLYVYVNNTLKAGPKKDSDCDIGSRTINGGGTGGTLIGRNRPDNSRFFDGKIDDVRIYDRALSEHEIEQLYDYSPDFCDARGLNNECIMNTTRELNQDRYNITSIFISEASAEVQALNGQAHMNIDNSSMISGIWQGSFFIDTKRPRLVSGARFRPENGDIVIGS